MHMVKGPVPMPPTAAEHASFVLETERLVLREIVQGDAALILAIDEDDEVMRFVDVGRPRTLRCVLDDVMPRMVSLTRDGFGFFKAVEKRSGEAVGWFHLKPPVDAPGAYELGYRLFRRYWGRGLATEGARALVEYGFATLGASRIVAHALLANQASCRVLRKAGLELEREYVETRVLFPDKRAGFFALSRSAWEESRRRGRSSTSPPEMESGGRSTPER